VPALSLRRETYCLLACCKELQINVSLRESGVGTVFVGADATLPKGHIPTGRHLAL
jgi:hypothetical protein